MCLVIRIAQESCKGFDLHGVQFSRAPLWYWGVGSCVEDSGRARKHSRNLGSLKGSVRDLWGFRVY